MQLSQTTLAYSSDGLMNVVHIFYSDVQFSLNVRLLRMSLTFFLVID